MNDRKWEAFFDLLSEIVKTGPGWKETRQEIMSRAVQYGCESTLAEFVSWFDGSDPWEFK